MRGSNDLVIVGTTILLLIGLWFVVQHTKTGTAMRAVSLNPEYSSMICSKKVLFGYRRR